MKCLDNEHSICYNIAYIPIYAVLIALFSACMREEQSEVKFFGKNIRLCHYWAPSNSI